MTQASLGAVVAVETLDGDEELELPAGTQTGKKTRLRGKGVPHVQGRGRGDLIITVVVDVPTELTKEQEDLLRQFAADRGEDVAEPDTRLFSKIRHAFK
jgi:molecular chaperone DnaJ